MKPSRKIVTFYDLVNMTVAMAVILGVMCAPIPVTSPLIFLPLFGAGFIGFFLVAMKAKRRAPTSLLSAFVWSIFTLFVAGIASIILHPHSITF